MVPQFPYNIGGENWALPLCRGVLVLCPKIRIATKPLPFLLFRYSKTHFVASLYTTTSWPERDHTMYVNCTKQTHFIALYR